MTAAHSTLPASELARLRRRTLWSLVASVALGSTGHIAAITVATIVARDIAGTTAWSGAPGAAVVLGAAFGSVFLSQLMVRFGRRRGLVLGYGFIWTDLVCYATGVSFGSRVVDGGDIVKLARESQVHTNSWLAN